MDIKLDQSGNPVQDKTFKDFKTDYLIGMTRIQKYVECIADKLKVKYNLTDDQYIDLVDIISNEQFSK
ncbi:hypothetical protein [Butyricimonas sp.]|uniref:hypothetical protein n=1 Tax=Butyricimonas sp. TaxID=1969738 RepID=UPI001B118051|nr:hypothetical protein [Butyricimonas sp.]MBO4960584.1 hypothetical protein [Butyricimonas sp.]